MGWATVLTNWAVNQKIKAAALNNLNAGILELQNAGLSNPGYMQIASSATVQTPANNTWTLLNMTATSLYTLGTGMTATATGIQVATAGRYRAVANVSFNTNATGFRGVGFGNGGASPSYGIQKFLVAVTGINTQADSVQDFTCAANDIVGVYAYQSSGAGLALQAAGSFFSLTRLA